MKKLEPLLIRQLLLIGVLLLFGFLIFKEMHVYFTGILGAITMYVLFRGWMRRLTGVGINKTISAFLLLLFSFVVILLPIIGILSMLGAKVGRAVTNSEKIINVIKDFIEEINTTYNIDIFSQINPSKIADWVSTSIQSLAGNSFDIILSIGVMYFLLFYMLVNREKLSSFISNYLPISPKNISIIEKESAQMVKANTIGIPVVALCQGVVALIGYLIFGITDPFFWFVITAIGSMIPFVGTFIAIIPVTLLTLTYGETWQGIAILIYGVVVVGSTDNIIRLFVLKRLDDVHPLITLLGVLIGIPLFGFLGLIFGPLLISLFLLLIKIYKKEFGY